MTYYQLDECDSLVMGCIGSGKTGRLEKCYDGFYCFQCDQLILEIVRYE